MDPRNHAWLFGFFKLTAPAVVAFLLALVVDKNADVSLVLSAHDRCVALERNAAFRAGV
jgi:hypothetical protein